MDNAKGIAIGLIDHEEDCNLQGFHALNQDPCISYDSIVLTREDLGEAIDSLSRQQGIISSRWLVTNQISGNKKGIEQGDEIALVQARYGREKQFVGDMTASDQGDSVLSVKGVYDYIVIKQPEKRTRGLEERLRLSPNVRDFLVLTAGNNVSVPLPENVPQPHLSGRNYLGFNKYEGPHHTNNLGINLSYFEGCKKIAQDLLERCEDLDSTVIYAPLRGAKPMTDLTMEFLKQTLGEAEMPRVIYPVTSSFVRYPFSQGFCSKIGRSPASGRYANTMELRRLRKHLKGVKNLVYIDEIVSGGMMTGHCKEMVGHPKVHKSDDRYHGELDEGILRDLVEKGDIRLLVYGLADREGQRFREKNKQTLEGFQGKGLMNLKCSPVENLITEDQRYLLGIHYLDYSMGPHSVPIIKNGEYYEDRTSFINDYTDTN